MKCNAWVTEITHKSGKKRIAFIANQVEYEKKISREEAWMLASERIRTPKTSAFSTPMKCGGKIVCAIDAVDEPGWGQSYATLQVRYECERCGCNSFPSLPEEHWLDKFVTDVIEKMPEPK